MFFEKPDGPNRISDQKRRAVAANFFQVSWDRPRGMLNSFWECSAFSHSLEYFNLAKISLRFIATREKYLYAVDDGKTLLTPRAIQLII